MTHRVAVSPRSAHDRWLSSGWRHLVSGALLTISTACGSIGAPPELDRVVSNVCALDLDCAQGSCDQETGRCMVRGGELTTVLLKITPPASDLDFGGFEVFQTLSLAGASRNLELSIRRPPRFSWRRLPWTPNDECFWQDLEAEFVPRERALGIDVPRYFVRGPKGFDESLREVINVFGLSRIPPGGYDVYWAADDEGVPGSSSPDARNFCPVAPQLVRGVELTENNELNTPFPSIQNPEPRALTVIVPWDAEEQLKDWIVDVVHPTTGEALSTQASLTADVVQPVLATTPDGMTADAGLEARVSLLWADVVGTDYAGLQREDQLLRLRPPQGVEGPTIFLVLVGLIDSEGQARLPVNRGVLPNFIEYRAWVWGNGEPERPATGTVTFVATNIAGPIGVTTNFSRTVRIGASGRVEAQLFPGDYDVRVFPDGDTGLTRYRTSIRVWAAPPTLDGNVQAGQVIAVPQAVRVVGEVSTFSNLTPRGVTVRISPVRRGLRNGRNPVFVPRTVSDLVEAEGDFELVVDCGRCTEEEPLFYDVRVIPPEGSGLPWVVRRGVAIGSELDLGTIAIGVPQLFRGRLDFVTAGGTQAPFPGPLIRAYALLDADDQLVHDPELPLCVEVPAAPGEPPTPCIQRALQIAEARADSAGEFELLFPREL